MFRNKLTYYHGTTESRWKKIQAEKLFKPNELKPIGSYWLTRGAYFVCENPYIALWYAHLSCFLSKNKKEKPVLISFNYQADRGNTGEVVNLLSSDGHKLLIYAHNKYKSIITVDEKTQPENNLDSKVLELLLKNSKKAKAVIAGFQEGISFQKLVHDGDYQNPHVVSQHGICPGDHAEICFYPNLSFDEVENIEVVNDADLVKDKKSITALWPLVCDSLNCALTNQEFRDGFSAYVDKAYAK